MAGLETVDLPVFDPELYEANKEKAKQGFRANNVLGHLMESANADNDDPYDQETGLPRLPLGEPLNPEGIPGLPPYNLVFDAEELIADNPPDEDEGEMPAESESGEIKLVFSSAPVINPMPKSKKVKIHRIDQKIDNFLKDIL